MRTTTPVNCCSYTDTCISGRSRPYYVITKNWKAIIAQMVRVGNLEADSWAIIHIAIERHSVRITVDSALAVGGSVDGIAHLGLFRGRRGNSCNTTTAKYRRADAFKDAGML